MPRRRFASAVIQHYSGSFCVSTGAGCTGTDVLSGHFTMPPSARFLVLVLSLNVNSPPDTLALSSSLIPAHELRSPSAFGLTFTNLTPDFAVVGSTIAGFTATFAGDASASTKVSEPASIALLGLAVVGLALVRRRSPYTVSETGACRA